MQAFTPVHDQVRRVASATMPNEGAAAKNVTSVRTFSRGVILNLSSKLMKSPNSGADQGATLIFGWPRTHSRDPTPTGEANNGGYRESGAQNEVRIGVFNPPLEEEAVEISPDSMISCPLNMALLFTRVGLPARRASLI